CIDSNSMRSRSRAPVSASSTRSPATTGKDGRAGLDGLIRNFSRKPRATFRIRSTTSPARLAWSWEPYGCSESWISQIRTSKSKRSADTNRRPSDPRRAKTLHLREVRIIRHNTAPETEDGGSNHTIRHGDVPMDALEEPGVPRQPDVERNYLEPRVLKGPQLGEGLL